MGHSIHKKFALALLFIIFMSGCSGSNGSGITASLPSELPQTNSQSPDSTSDRNLLGLYKLLMFEDGTYELMAVHLADMHVNVKNLLFPPKCIDCFVAELLSVNGEHWKFQFTIKNPTLITGYDCRVTLLEYGEITVLDPSSYTKTFALPYDPDPINPFVVFDTGNGQNEWAPGASATTIVNFVKPAGSKFTQIIFAIDGSYPGNQDDPYKISNLNAEPWYIKTDGSDTTNIAATVNDWQNNVNFVNIDLSPLGGSQSASMTNTLGNLWLIEDVAYSPGGMGLGTHYLKVTANSVGLETYNYVPVTVVDQTPVFSVEIQQDKTDVAVGETVTFTAIPTNGTPDYIYDWDMHYDGVSFNPETSGEIIQWDWDYVGEYTARVRCKDDVGGVAWADANVTVGGVDPAIHVVSPNGGEIITAGTAYEIKWSSAKVNGTILIQYSKDDFVSDCQTIANNQTNDGSFILGNVPPDYTTTAKVRVSSTDNPAVNDVSDNYFTIKQPGGCDPGPEIFTTSLPDSILGQAYSKQLECTGGEGFVTWVVLATGDTLPDGLELDLGGLLHGTPLDGTDGTYNLKIQAFDSCVPTPQTDEVDLTLKVLNLTGTWFRDFKETTGGVFAGPLGVSKDDIIYITSSFQGINDFNPGGSVENHTAPYGNSNAFLTSYAPNGDYRWTRTWGATIPEVDTFGRDVAVDSGGNVYAIGYFGPGEVDFDPGSGVDKHTGPGNYLVKFDTDGNFQWVWTMWNDDSSMLPCPIAIDANDNIFVVQYLSGLTQLFKLDSGSSPLWQLDWPNFFGPSDIAIDISGDAYLTGRFDNSTDFDPGPGEDLHASNGHTDVYLMKIDSAGQYQWSRTWGGYGYDSYPSGTFVVAKTNIYVCGNFIWTVDFDPDPVGVLEKTSMSDLGEYFISSFDSSGDFLAVTTWGEPDGIIASDYSDFCMDSFNNSYVTEWQNLMKLDSSGSLLWFKKYPDNGDYLILNSVALLSEDSPIISGDGWVRRLTSDGY